MFFLYLDIPLGTLNRLVTYMSGILGGDSKRVSLSPLEDWVVGLVTVDGLDFHYRDLIKEECAKACEGWQGIGFSLTRLIIKDTKVLVPLEGGLQELKECRERLVQDLSKYPDCSVKVIDVDTLFIGMLNGAQDGEVRFKRPISWTAQTLWIGIKDEDYGTRRLYRLQFGGR